jgi:hypothetical protein
MTRMDFHWLRVTEGRDLLYFGGGGPPNATSSATAGRPPAARTRRHTSSRRPSRHPLRNVELSAYCGHAFGQGVVRKGFPLDHRLTTASRGDRHLLTAAGQCLSLMMPRSLTLCLRSVSPAGGSGCSYGRRPPSALPAVRPAHTSCGSPEVPDPPAGDSLKQGRRPRRRCRRSRKVMMQQAGGSGTAGSRASRRAQAQKAPAGSTRWAAGSATAEPSPDPPACCHHSPIALPRGNQPEAHRPRTPLDPGKAARLAFGRSYRALRSRPPPSIAAPARSARPCADSASTSPASG